MSEETIAIAWLDRRDAAAFKEIINRHAAMVYGTCLRILGNSTDAADVTQECFEALAQTRELPGRKLMGPWLHGVATKRALMHIRGEKRREDRERRYAGEQPDAYGVEWDDIYDLVDKAITDLPEDLRVPLVAHYLENKSHSVIARRLGIPRRTVSDRVQRGLDRVRENLEQRGVRITAAALGTLFTANLAAASVMPAALNAKLGKLTLAASKCAADTATVPGWWTTLVNVPIWTKVAAMSAVVAAAVIVAAPKSEPTTASTSQSPPASPASPPSPPPSLTKPSADQSGGNPVVLAAADVEPSDTTSQASNGITISGRVYDADTGEGIEPARISARSLSGNYQDFRSNATESDGYYRIEGVPPGMYELWMGRAFGETGSRYGGAWFAEEKVMVEDEDLVVDFPIDRHTVVSGRVVDTNGDPVADAEVWGTPSGKNERHEPTEDDGSFELFRLPTSDELYVYAVTEAMSSEVLGPFVLTRQGIKDVEIELTVRNSAGIGGTVVDQFGKPRNGMRVQAFGPSPSGAWHVSGKTGADGAFALPHLPPGDYRVEAIVQPSQKMAPVTLTPGQHVSGLVLEAATDEANRSDLSIAGRVLNEQGESVPHVRVWAGGVTGREDYTDNEGMFRVSGLRPGNYSVSVDTNDNRRAHVDVPAGSEDVKLVLEPYETATINGTVINAVTGEPIGGAKVLHWGKAAVDHLYLWENPDTVTGPAGAFTIEDIDRRFVVVHARAPGFAIGYREIRLPTASATFDGVRIPLTPGAIVEGRVLAPDSQPIEGAHIFVGKLYQPDVPESGAAATSAADGTFRIDTIAETEHVIWADHPDFARTSIPINPRSGRTERRNIGMAPGGTVEGSVSIGGEPVEQNVIGYIDHAQVYFWFPERAELGRERARTGTDGTFRKKHLAPGTVDVVGQITFPGGRDGITRKITKAVTVAEAETTRVAFNFEPGACTLEGTLYVDGEPRPYHSITASHSTKDGHTEQFEVETDGLARYKLIGLPTSINEVTISPGGGDWSQAAPVHLEPGAVHLDIRL